MEVELACHEVSTGTGIITRHVTCVNSGTTGEAATGQLSQSTDDHTVTLEAAGGRGGMSIPMVGVENDAGESNSGGPKGKGRVAMRDFNIHVIRQTASQRWFSPPEIESILSRYESLGFALSGHPPLDPASGDLYIYNRANVKNFKADGILWSKKKGSDRTQETYQVIKINGAERMVGVYCKSQDNPTFRKRYYRLTCDGPDMAEIVFVHYRSCFKGEGGASDYCDRPQKHASDVSSHFEQTSSPAAEALLLDMTETELLADTFDYETLQELVNWSNSLAETGDGSDPMDINTNKSARSTHKTSSDGTHQRSSSGSNGIRASKASTAPHRAAVSLFQPVTAISDFSPSRDCCAGGVKVLLCLSNGLAANYTHSATLQVSFGGTAVPAEVLSPTVLRCRAPARMPGCCTLCVTTMHGQVLSPPTEQLFEYSFVSFEVNSHHLLANSGACPENSGSNPHAHRGYLYHKRPLVSLSGETLPPAPPSATTFAATRCEELGGLGAVIENEHKIRIVEKLGLMSNNIDSSAAGDPEAADEENWLDEHDFSLLQPADLEKLMDRYLMSVVKQLVEIASVDDELRAELDSLDSNGYSLLHYCCMYNLNALVPILIAKGASISQRTSGGSSSLHLSAGAGCLAVTQMLIQHGADLNERDLVGEVALDKALQGGHHDIVDFLTMASRSRLSYGGGALSHSTSLVSSTQSSGVSRTPRPTEGSWRKQQGGFAGDGHSPVDRQPPPCGQGSGGQKSRGTSGDKLLHGALHTLSLADKCALSLTMVQNKGNSDHLLNSPPPEMSDNSNSHHLSHISIDDPAPGIMRLSSGGGSSEHFQEYMELEMSSVFSETDKESLDVAMKMMTSHELHQLEIEARRIQNNVRGWLLRKNYTNLRESARVLQAAWREHKNSGMRTSGCSNFQRGDAIANDTYNSFIGITGESASNNFVDRTSAYPGNDVKAASNDESNIDDDAMIIDREQAAARLQAATRRFIARKSFSLVRSQIASTLIIQKQIASHLK